MTNFHILKTNQLISYWHSEEKLDVDKKEYSHACLG